MNRIGQTQKVIFGMLLLVVALWFSGCGTIEGDADNASSRPWNAPKTWETGLPSTINEGR